MKKTLYQFIKLGFGILLLACILGIIDRSFFEDKRLPACEDSKIPTGHICLDTLLRKWGSRIVWIDARSQGDFEINHLQLAENRLFQIQASKEKQAQIDAAMERLMASSERQECIVIFCTLECSKSDDIAEELRALELIDAPIYVLEGGWAAIRKEGSLIH